MTYYFEKAGDHTTKVFELVQKRIEQGDIRYLVLATTRGETALKASEFFKDLSLPIIAVTHQAGFREPGGMEISAEVINTLEERGITVLTATHALAGVGRAIRKKHGTWQISELIADSLRIFGQGTKVCVEIILMAADAGLIDIKDTIAIGGTGWAADTAWVITPAHTNNFFDMKIKELICKPKDF